MGTTSKFKETDLVDIDSYCNELSIISGLNVGTVRFVVLTNFASVYSNKVSFTDATSKIVEEICTMIQEPTTVIPVNNGIKKQALLI